MEKSPPLSVRACSQGCRPARMHLAKDLGTRAMSGWPLGIHPQDICLDTRFVAMRVSFNIYKAWSRLRLCPGACEKASISVALQGAQPQQVQSVPCYNFKQVLYLGRSLHHLDLASRDTLSLPRNRAHESNWFVIDMLLLVATTRGRPWLLPQCSKDQVCCRSRVGSKEDVCVYFDCVRH